MAAATTASLAHRFCISIAVAMALLSASRAGPIEPYVVEDQPNNWLGEATCLITQEHLTSECGPNRARDRNFIEDWFNEKPISIPVAPVGVRAAFLTRVNAGPSARGSDQRSQRLRTMDDMVDRYYPWRQRFLEVEQRVAMRCGIDDDGYLRTCLFLDDGPDVERFHEATRNVLNHIRFVQPLPAQRWQDITIPWRVPALTKQVFVECLITAQFETRDCTTKVDDRRPDLAKSVLTELERQPLSLPGAPVGERIEIALLRSALANRPSVPREHAARASAPTAVHGPYPWDSWHEYYPSESVRLREEGTTIANCRVFRVVEGGGLTECWISPKSAVHPRLRHMHLKICSLLILGFDAATYNFAIAWRLPPPASSHSFLVAP